ncbi:MAG: cob(I)yrinic acid a,c-diamide adenosyltransferase [Bacteroidetes bacterium]|nr:cob(I)yrinic acid a,c-diamide adenosyltransferase [Bacteroidota bacterium]MBL6944132.1 cob(I)yrinic acid a,c-diamide adenosyltransferase [Bacteroidales bacterium]
MKIYTKTGDSGTTALIGGTRVPKYDLRIHCYGTVDELSSWIGLIRDQEVGTKIANDLVEVLDRLFTIESILACDTSVSKNLIPEISEKDIHFLEDEIDSMTKELPELKSFLLSGGNTIVSYCHIARTICRRVERIVIQLSEEHNINPFILAYLNRLSDYLFVLSRKIGQDNNAKEILWKPRI